MTGSSGAVVSAIVVSAQGSVNAPSARSGLSVAGRRTHPVNLDNLGFAPQYGCVPADRFPRDDADSPDQAAASSKTAGHEHAARVAAARGLVVVRNRTGKPIPDYVRELAGPDWK